MHFLWPAVANCNNDELGGVSSYNASVNNALTKLHCAMKSSGSIHVLSVHINIARNKIFHNMVMAPEGGFVECSAQREWLNAVRVRA